MTRRMGGRPSLAKNLAIFAAALITSVLLLPAMVAGWYYVSPESFHSAIGFVAAVTDPATAPSDKPPSSQHRLDRPADPTHAPAVVSQAPGG